MRPNRLKTDLANGETRYGTMIFEFLSGLTPNTSQRRIKLCVL